MMSVVITARHASDDEIAAEMDRRGTVIEALEADRDRWQYLAKEWERQHNTARAIAGEWEARHDIVEADRDRLRALNAELLEALIAADGALARITAFEADARHIMGNTNFEIVKQRRRDIHAAIAKARLAPTGE